MFVVVFTPDYLLWMENPEAALEPKVAAAVILIQPLADGSCPAPVRIFSPRSSDQAQSLTLCLLLCVLLLYFVAYLLRLLFYLLQYLFLRWVQKH